MTTSYRPEEDVVEICRDLIRIDSTNYGDGSGPGERQAAEYVAEKLADVGIESELFEPAKGRTSLVARWGDPEGSRPPARARPPGRRTRRQAGLEDRPVRGRDRRRLPLGQGRGRHEGLRRGHPVGGAGAHPRRASCRSARSRWCSRRTRRRAASQGAHSDRRPAAGVARGLHRGHRRGRRLLDNRCRQADLPGRDGREGHRLAAPARPRHGRARVDAQHRQRGDRHLRGGRDRSAGTSGRCGSRRPWARCSRRWRG